MYLKNAYVAWTSIIKNLDFIIFLTANHPKLFGKANVTEVESVDFLLLKIKTNDIENVTHKKRMTTSIKKNLNTSNSQINEHYQTLSRMLSIYLKD